MSDTGYIRHGKRVVYENAWLRFEAHDIVHPTGSPGVHGVLVTSPASAAVLFDGERVLLVQQSRFAVDAVVLEVVKGGREHEESALDCVIRESREEAGVAARRWIELGTTYEIPSIVQHPVALFLGVDLSPAPLAPEEIERIAVVPMRLDDAIEAVTDGRIDDAVTAIALLRARRALRG